MGSHEGKSNKNATKTLGTLRETLGTPIKLHHCQVRPGNTGNTKGNTGDANKHYATARLCWETQGTLRATLGTPLTLS